MAVVLHPIACAQCGAANQRPGNALVMLCDYCGAFVGCDASQMRGEGLLALHFEGKRRLVSPSLAEARQLELIAEMQDASLDRETWRALAAEYHGLHGLTRPELVPESCRGDGMRDWVAAAVRAQELTTFDPDVLAAQAEMVAATTALQSGKDGLVEKARALLTAIEAFHCTLIGHPDYLVIDAMPDPKHLARGQLRQTVAGLEMLISPAAARAIYTEVLGDRIVEEDALSCPVCGAPVGEAERAARACAYCGGRLSLQSDASWLEGKRAQWKMLSGVARDDVAALAGNAVSMAVTPFHIGGGVPDAGDILVFLREVVPHASREHLLQMLGALRSAYGETEGWTEMADALEHSLDGWKPGPPPAPDEEPELPAEAEDSEAWVRQQLATLEMAPPAAGTDPSLHLLSLAIAPFWMGGGVRPETAVDFFRRAGPDFDVGAMRAAVQLMRGAHSDERVVAFLDALAAALR